MTRTHCPPSTSHSSRAPSSLPLSRLPPSGVKARPSTTPLWPENTSRVRPSWASHSRMVRSLLPLASVAPSGLHATQFTCSVCPTSVWRRRRRPPSPSSHSLTLPSQLALARLVPSGAKASPRTQLLCPAWISTQPALPRDVIPHRQAPFHPEQRPDSRYPWSASLTKVRSHSRPPTA